MWIVPLEWFPSLHSVRLLYWSCLIEPYLTRWYYYHGYRSGVQVCWSRFGIAMIFLPSATVVAERLCFHKRLSFCLQGGLADTPPDTPWADTPWADTLWANIPPRQTPPPWADTPRADIPTRQTHPPWADTPRQTPPGRHPPGDDHCWNAFLFAIRLQ